MCTCVCQHSSVSARMLLCVEGKCFFTLSLTSLLAGFVSFLTQESEEKPVAPSAVNGRKGKCVNVLHSVFVLK